MFIKYIKRRWENFKKELENENARAKAINEVKEKERQEAQNFYEHLKQELLFYKDNIIENYKNGDNEFSVRSQFLIWEEYERLEKELSWDILWLPRKLSNEFNITVKNFYLTKSKLDRKHCVIWLDFNKGKWE